LQEDDDHEHDQLLGGQPEDRAEHGIEVQQIFDLARQAAIPVAETNLTRHDVYIADESFLTGTGAEVTRNAVIVNPVKITKRSIRHDYMYPALCIVDPELALNASFESSSSSAIDALCHLLEGYTSIKSGPASDVLALAAGLGDLASTLQLGVVALVV